MTAPIVLERDQAATDFRRNGRGQPLITPPDGTKPIPYQRASNAGKAVDDTFNLEKWARRNVAFGVARDQSLVARMLAIGGTPHTWTDDEKRAVNDICDAATQIAQAHRGADIGTAVHELTHQADRGLQVHAGPYQADLDAYQAAIYRAGFEVVEDWIECRLVCDELRIAGTADRILRRISDGRCFVADIKTGRLDYGALTWAVQLAAYARGVLYDPTTDTRLPTPEMDQDRGLIIHLPAGEGRCELHWIDLQAGYRTALLAAQVRETRSASKGWITPMEMPEAEMVALLAASLEANEAAADVQADPARIRQEAERLRVRWRAAIKAGAPPRELWPTGVRLFKDGGPTTWQQLLAVEEAVYKAEGHVGIPFPDEPALPADPNAPVEAPRPIGAPTTVEVDTQPAPTDAGPVVDREALKAMHDTLPEDLQAAAYAAALDAGVPTSYGQRLPEHWVTVQDLLEAAHREHQHRQDRLNHVAATLDDAPFLAVLYQAAGITDPTVATGAQVEIVEALVAAHTVDAVALEITSDGELVLASTPAAVDAVVAHRGSKADALAAAKEIAALHGRPKPRSAALAAQDPVLVALLLAAP